MPEPTTTTSTIKMFRPPFRIRNLVLYTLLYLLGFLSCILYLQIAYVTSGAGRQVVIESDLLSAASGEGESSLSTGQVQQEPCTSAAGAIRNTNSHNLPLPLALNNNLNLYYEEVTNDLTRNTARTSSATGSATDDGSFTHRGHQAAQEFLAFTGGTGATSARLEKPKDITTVYVVTPTFYRPEQKPELTRLAQSLLPASHFIHWIVIDDISQGSDASARDLQRFLLRFPLTITFLKSIPRSSSVKVVGKPRGVNGRRAAIDWLRKNAQSGVVYFADDDNTYDSDIFRQIQTTKKISMWPVGLVTELGVSSPIVKNGRVIGFFDGWNGRRKFPVDMAGFAINMELFHKHEQANMPWVAGYEEDELLRSLEIKISDIVPLANNCTEILVWHTKALRNGWPKRPRSLKTATVVSTNLQQLLKNLPQKSLAGPNSSTKAVTIDSNNSFSFFKLFFGDGGGGGGVGSNTA